jgi:flagellar hook-associated protein 1 FlgK
MSDLISIGRSGVLAYREAMATTGENVVNADTEGFARRQVTLREQAVASGPTMLARNSASFAGVQSASVTRVWDQYRASNAWTANADSASADTRATWLGTIETTLDDSDAGVGVKLTSVFAAGTALAANPSDTTLRQSMLFALSDAASAIGRTGDTLRKTADTMADNASNQVSQVNDALQALSKLNIALKTSPANSAGRAQLEDQRDSLIGTISGNIGVDVTFDSTGAVSLKLNDYAGPQILSSASTDVPLIGLQRALDGRLSLTMTANGASSVVPATAGALAGFADASVTLADRRRQIDDLANTLTTQVNAWNAQGYLANGSHGAPLLTGTTAATIALATSDPTAIAAASATSDNGNLTTLNDLRGATGVEAKWRAISTDQALLVASAKTRATAAATQKDSAYTAVDQVSGIDLDNEAANLMRFQQAYSASAKIIQTARETLQAILDIV